MENEKVKYITVDEAKAICGATGADVDCMVSIKELEDDLKCLSVFLEFVGDEEEIMEAAALILI
jgi:hypothetical protein